MSDAQKRAAALQYLIGMEGWSCVEQFMLERIDDGKNRLLTCELDDVPKHRAEVKALQSVFTFINDSIEEGQNSENEGE